MKTKSGGISKARQYVKSHMWCTFAAVIGAAVFAAASRAAVLHAGTILFLFASDDLFDTGGSAGYRRGKPGKAAG